MSKPSDSWPIGAVAREMGMRPSALRYYESVGILPAPERREGRRFYDASVFAQVRRIQTAQKAGFTIGEIKALLDETGTGRPYAARLQEMARRKLAEVEQVIADAEVMRRILTAGLDCQCAGSEDCLALLSDAR